MIEGAEGDGSVVLVVVVGAVVVVVVVVTGPPPTSDTLLSVAVASTGLLWLVSARPMNTVWLIAIVSLPTCVHVTPSGERYAEKTLPARLMRTHSGAVAAPPLVLVFQPLVTVRRWNAAPLPGVSTIMACVDVGVRVSRIITPAFAHGLVLLTDPTCAISSPSPLSAW